MLERFSWNVKLLSVYFIATVCLTRACHYIAGLYWENEANDRVGHIKNHGLRGFGLNPTQFESN